MEKRKWLWKRKSSERIPGETESSGSISSLSERYSDDQMEGFKGSPNSNNQSPEVTSKTMSNGEDVDDSIRRLTEKLSAALVNVSAKDDLVKQHAKVAEEAVAGWENAENEVAVLKQKLEAAVQQNSTLDDRVTHLDGAVKECVRQLRQAREEQEQKIHEAVMKKTREWESTKFELESQLLELQNKADAVLSESPAHSDPDLRQRLESLEKENSVLKLELLSQSEELEIRTIERDLSAQAAETASKQHLESIKKVAKLEAECRRLKAMASKSASINDHRSTGASSIYVESLTDSQSDSGERLDALDIDSRKMSGIDQNKCEPGCSDSWASALIAELDQFRNEKAGCKNIPTSSIEIGLMDDFLEMERLAALPETQHKNQQQESESAAKNSSCTESSLRAELDSMIRRTAELEEKLETMEREKAEIELEFSAKANETITLLRFELEHMIHRATDLEEKLEKVEAEKAELRKANETITLLRFELETMIHGATDLEEKLEKVEAEKAELRNALNESQNSLEASQARLSDVESELEELQKGFLVANEAKHSVESRLITLSGAQSMSMRSNSLEADLTREVSSAQ
ncbi:filament-like plant protein, partial [Carica papaya]|uniref:filament-like plant protein n=1 Tax=Carica papaya TaxID=3649 RepID=UPI000B8C9D05